MYDTACPKCVLKTYKRRRQNTPETEVMELRVRGHTGLTAPKGDFD